MLLISVSVFYNIETYFAIPGVQENLYFGQFSPKCPKKRGMGRKNIFA